MRPGHQAKPAGGREVQANDVEAEAQAATSAEIDAPEAEPEINRPEPEAEPAIGQPAGELAGIDPEALATMATIQGNLADAEAAAEQSAEKEARRLGRPRRGRRRGPRSLSGRV